MGTMLEPVITTFNRSFRIESRADRLTGLPTEGTLAHVAVSK